MRNPNCQDLLRQLSIYIDGEAEPQLCAVIERHLASCSHCRIVVDTLGKTVSLYRTLPDSQMPEGVQERLYRVLQIS